MYTVNSKYFSNQNNRNVSCRVIILACRIMSTIQGTPKQSSTSFLVVYPMLVALDIAVGRRSLWCQPSRIWMSAMWKAIKFQNVMTFSFVKRCTLVFLSVTKPWAKSGGIQGARIVVRNCLKISNCVSVNDLLDRSTTIRNLWWDNRRKQFSSRIDSFVNHTRTYIDLIRLAI